jgi:hypothetical protein
LPIGTLLRIDFSLKNPDKKISVTGRVKWNKVIIENHYCEAGVEFIDTPAETFSALEDYISHRLALKNTDPLRNLFRSSSKNRGSGTQDPGASQK